MRVELDGGAAGGRRRIAGRTRALGGDGVEVAVVAGGDHCAQNGRVVAAGGAASTTRTATVDEREGLGARR